jgi:tetratricopeptide (TPR) repeat protein
LTQGGENEMIMKQLSELRAQLHDLEKEKSKEPASAAPGGRRKVIIEEVEDEAPKVLPVEAKITKEVSSWQELQTCDNRTYFMNTSSGFGQWDRPAHFSAARSTTPASSSVSEVDSTASRALTLKELGNTAFKKQDWSSAHSNWSASLSLSPDVLVFCNRAAACLKLARFSDAVVDCDAALAIDATCVKAFFRRGVALRNLGRPKEAARDLLAALQLDSENAAVIAELKLLPPSDVAAIKNERARDIDII